VKVIWPEPGLLAQGAELQRKAPAIIRRRQRKPEGVEQMSIRASQQRIGFVQLGASRGARSFHGVHQLALLCWTGQRYTNTSDSVCTNAGYGRSCDTALNLALTSGRVEKPSQVVCGDLGSAKDAHHVIAYAASLIAGSMDSRFAQAHPVDREYDVTIRKDRILVLREHFRQQAFRIGEVEMAFGNVLRAQEYRVCCRF